MINHTCEAAARATGLVLVGPGSPPRVVPVEVVARVESCSASEAALTITGLPDNQAREARIRVRSALGYDVHRAAVEVRGLPVGATTASLDLAIAAAVMRGMGTAVAVAPEIAFVGELALDGRVRPVRGAACFALDHAGPLVLPSACAWEAGLRPRVQLVDKLADLCEPPREAELSRFVSHVSHGREELPEALRQALDEVLRVPRALLVGPPGTGKSMVARAVARSLPPLDEAERLEVAQIYSAAGLIGGPLSLVRPFRAPHHTVSAAGLLGEVALAHRGVLFLDELPEFRLEAIDALARTLAKGGATPAAVVGAANPCPCGGFGSRRECRCSPNAVARYQDRLRRYAEIVTLDVLMNDGPRTKRLR